MTASSGVDMMATMCGNAMTITAASATDTPRNSVTVLPMERDAACMSRPPTARAIVIVVPIARPTMMTVTMCMTWLPMDTAVMLAAPWNWPMIKRSAMP